MDKIKSFMAVLVRHHFWVMSVVVLLVSALRKGPASAPAQLVARRASSNPPSYTTAWFELSRGDPAQPRLSRNGMTRPQAGRCESWVAGIRLVITLQLFVA